MTPRVRTLIVSDLHLGNRLRRDVLTRPAALERLLTAVQDIDRLVLLGDVMELMYGRRERVLAVAEPVLRAVAERLAPDAQVILVPGNHDLPLIGRWIRANRSRLRLDTIVPRDASPPLMRLAEWLGPQRLEVRYPGVWLAAGVWATHGHYIDRHLLPQSAYGLSRGLFGGLPDTPATPRDYERRRPSLSAAGPWLPSPLARLVEEGSDVIRAATMPRVRRSLLHPRLAPLTSSLLALQMRRAAIPTLTYVCHRLGVQADWLVFGHVHRLGPLRGDDPEPWCGDGGGPRVVNSGSWLYEPLLVHRATPPHPYWPGGAVLLQDGGEPRPYGLLDDLGPMELR